MTRRSALLAIGGVAVAALSLVFTGVLARPLIVVAVWLLALAGLEERRHLHRQIRVFTQQRRAVALLIAVAVLGLVGFWATQPFFHRRAILGQLTAFSAEGRRIKSDFARLAVSNQPQGESTAKIQDWHHRVEAWVGEDLGLFYKSRLATPQGSSTYPAQMPARLWVFWDILETDLAAMDRFQAEFSGWLF
jgi:hypothetical protein